jgi:rhodanese-related sulfurtransferase
VQKTVRTEPAEPEPEPEPEPEIEVDTDELREWLASDTGALLVDIREPHELRSGYAEGALLLRMNDIPQRLDELPDRSVRLVVYCAAGARSYGVTHWLREQGWEDAWSLSSGFSGAIEAGVGVVRPD